MRLFSTLLLLALAVESTTAQSKQSLLPENRGGSATRFGAKGSTDQKRRREKAQEMRRRAREIHGVEN